MRRLKPAPTDEWSVAAGLGLRWKKRNFTRFFLEKCDSLRYFVETRTSIFSAEAPGRPGIARERNARKRSKIARNQFLVRITYG